MIVGDLEFIWYDGPGQMLGVATTLPVEPEDDTVRRLRAVIEEVTGEPVESPPPKPRMGFL
jgi:hypothetical protein